MPCVWRVQGVGTAWQQVGSRGSRRATLVIMGLEALVQTPSLALPLALPLP